MTLNADKIRNQIENFEGRAYRLQLSRAHTLAVSRALEVNVRFMLGEVEEAIDLAMPGIADEVKTAVIEHLQKANVRQAIVGQNGLLSITSNSVRAEVRNLYDIFQSVNHTLELHPKPIQVGSEALPVCRCDSDLYVIELSVAQAQALQNACELLFRAQLFQFDVFAFDHLMWLPTDEFCDVRDAICECRQIAERNAGYSPGITNKKVDDSARLACEVQQAVRYRLSFDRFPEGGITVNFDRPTGFSGQLPQPQIKHTPSFAPDQFRQN